MTVPTSKSNQASAALLAELASRIARHAAADGGHSTAIGELAFWRFSNPTTPAQVMQQPAVYIVVQGRKMIRVGDEELVYDPSQYLAVSMEIPAVGQVIAASPEKPYLCATISVDPRTLASLIVESGQHAPHADHDGRAVFVSRLDAPLLDGLLRLVRLLDAPTDIPVLAPLVVRELHYRLLQGEQKSRLAEIAIGNGRVRRVAGAIAWIKEHFSETLKVDALAKASNMSTSALHAHFKAVTAMSPVQYQKRLRLQEARHRLLVAGASAETVAYDVGYASPSQFSREYARLFGEPPRRDAERMRAEATGATPSSVGRARARPKRRTK